MQVAESKKVDSPQDPSTTYQALVSIHMMCRVCRVRGLLAAIAIVLIDPRTASGKSPVDELRAIAKRKCLTQFG